MSPLDPCAQNPSRPPISPIPGTEQTPPDGAAGWAGSWAETVVTGSAAWAGVTAAWAAAGRPRIAATAPASSSARQAGRATARPQRRA